MKKNLKNNSVITFVLVSAMLLSCNRDKHAEHNDTYTCPMHPTVISDRPATCPVCGMDLVRKARPGEEVVMTEDLRKLTQSANETVIASVKTVKGQFKDQPIHFEALGIVTYDTRNIYTVSARFEGRVEKIDLKYAYQPVKKGQRIAEIYSPALVTAQRELLYLIEHDPGNTALIQGAKNKLLLLGVSAAQITTLIETGKVGITVAVFSPYDGYIIAADTQPPVLSAPASSSGMSGGMKGGMSDTQTPQNTAEPQSTPVGNFIREGSYVSKGQVLCKIVNTSSLRVDLDLPASQASLVKEGQAVELDFADNEIEKTTIDLVQPFFSEGQNFVRVRVYTRKAQALHIGHLVRARFRSESKESLWVPRESVLTLGLDQVVFVKERGAFKPKKVTTGMESNSLVQIINGLASSEEIASNAQFLIDSESFVKFSK